MFSFLRFLSCIPVLLFSCLVAASLHFSDEGGFLICCFVFPGDGGGMIF